MTVSKQQCDICGEGNESNGLKLCIRCELLEEEVGGDIGLLHQMVMGG